MASFHAFLLGLIQGFTEFFPISSSAHLKLFRFFLDIPETNADVLFDLVCHLGTLFSILFFLRKDIVYVLTSFTQIKRFFLALLPLFPAYFLLHPLVTFFSGFSFLGFSFLVTSTLLFLASLKKPKSLLKPKISDVLWIGGMQALALIPGISRLGATTSTACLRGWKLQEAFKFSFLLAIPTILGGNGLEFLKILTSKKAPVLLPTGTYLIAFFTSFLVGLFSIHLVFRLSKNKHLRIFAWYCLSLGIFCLIYFNVWCPR